MSIVVEHEKRRHEILEKALDVFTDIGFENATFQKIADKCGITRTTLYIYFKNKKEIFSFSIKQFLQNLENDITKISMEKNKSHADKLIRLLTVVIESLDENRRILSVVLDYIRYASREGNYDPDSRVRRRTMRLRHILATVVINGIKGGEFKQTINVKEANELLYSFIDAAVYRLVILQRSSVAELKAAVKLAVQSLSAV